CPHSGTYHKCRTDVRNRGCLETPGAGVLASCKSGPFRRRRPGTQEGIGRWTDRSLGQVFLPLLSPPSLDSLCCFQLRLAKPTAAVTTTTDTATSVGTARSMTTTITMTRATAVATLKRRSKTHASR